MARQYQVWAYNETGYWPKEGWDVQYYSTYKEALAEAKSKTAEEVYIEIYQDGKWVNDHIEQKFVRKEVVA